MTRFDPRFQITMATAAALMRIEAAREAVGRLPIRAFSICSFFMQICYSVLGDA